ncbi:hypothetical protein HQ325_00910 [Rhodococcus sp. BP-349]|uniref:hypothetical protein n=1 Tax=unclassified Rhodococcus (in: high G+C Gram-positive bacteria) TaxID=192944 RepID=UPI001C9B5862|nr:MULTISPECIES: hypothetical protein [unclassified Rhodococcus (in: high G+C Gram-positive bacteria)]MBY6537222.1 hypothetical protein [Rhodococcus sp. BP-363]MBY6541559.1 hypothetical protein [Rhodococcus sp. BP-369]MBY6560789.1 hypothetical protein [Rhodococcus sp. BP-370]MBY6575081.1 hypothetical protein [Rhodococcus sp. BP-364]MBY6584382.1 hypothetical protein [Rhodococcus sp. BP-358]
MWWFIVGIVAVWSVVAVMLGVRMGRSIRTADIEEEAGRLRRDEHERAEQTKTARLDEFGPGRVDSDS